MPEQSPSEPAVVRFIADVQIRLPEEKPPLPHLAEVAILRHVTSSSPHCQGNPLGELPPLPDPARVSSPLLVVGGRKRCWAVDLYLIGRPASLRTPLATASADHRDPRVGRLKAFLPMRHASWTGLAWCRPGSVQIGP
jgi:hypothetical protein